MAGTPVVLQAHVDVASYMLCSDCESAYREQRIDQVPQSDFVILTDQDPDWKAVCEDCSSEYDWTRAEVQIDDLDYDQEEQGPPF